MSEWILDLTLEEPFTCAERPAESNEIRGLDYIPGPTLRGSVAGALVREGRARQLEAWFGLNGPRWTPALPAGGWDTVVPMPLSFAVPKGHRPFRDFDVWNRLHAPAPHIAALPFVQWTGVKERWLGLQAGLPIDCAGERREASMHVGLNYASQASREGALFSRSEIAAGARFRAWVRDPGNVLSEVPETIFLGKRRSAGNGAATLTIKPGPFPWAGQGASGTKVLVQLISDAIVPHREGGFRQGLDRDAWAEILDVPVDNVAAFSGSRPVLGWSQAKGLPRGRARAVAAGSVFKIECSSGQNPITWKAAWERVAIEGIGARREEGFGWVAVNPRWLEEPSIPPRKAPDEARRGEPESWPGLEKEPSEALVRLSRLAKTAAPSSDKQKVDLRLLRSLARVKTLQQLQERGTDFATGLSSCASIEQARFFLEATAIHSGEK
jgi:hypothetical protein